MRSVICSVLHIQIDQVENRTISEYWELREQAFNVGSWMAGGKLNLETTNEEMDILQKQIKYAKEQGCLGKRRKIS